jgi:very-short-patch-repair endonuclease
VFGADGTKIAIECDGDYWHGDQFEQDMQRQEILERAGWQFFRILGSSPYLGFGLGTKIN